MCRKRKKHLKLRPKAKKLIYTITILSTIPTAIKISNDIEKAICTNRYRDVIDFDDTTLINPNIDNPINIDEDTFIDIQETNYNSINWQLLGNELPMLGTDNTITIDSNLQNYIYQVSEEFNVPYELALSVCYIESEFSSNVNNEGLNTDGTIDYGIMGLNDRYLESNCNLYNDGYVIDPYNPYDNVYIGVQILANNLRYFDGNIYDAANAYNLGINGWENMKNQGKSWYYGDMVMNYISTLETYVLNN